MLQRLINELMLRMNVRELFQFESSAYPCSPLIDLRERLKIDLKLQIAEEALIRIKSTNKAFEISRAAMIFGSAFALVTIVTFYVFLQAQRDAGTPFEFTWLKMPTFAVGVSIAFFTGGFFTLNRLSKEMFEPLHSNGRNIFQSEEMNAHWNLFLKWAKQHLPLVYVNQSDGHIRSISDVWDNANRDIFILGSNTHRRELVANKNLLTSNLMLSEKDWHSFLESSVENQHNINTDQYPNPKSVGPKDKSYSLRQLKHGPSTKAAPRFELLVIEPFFKNRYPMDAKFAPQEANIACHAALSLVLMSETNKDLFKILASNNGIAKNEAQRDFLIKLDRALNVKPNRYETRRDQILKYKWNVLELHLERLNIISDDELKKYHPEFSVKPDSLG